MSIKKHPRSSFHTTPHRTVRFTLLAAGCLGLFLSLDEPALEAREIPFAEARFEASRGQTLFPSEELTLFKQFLFEWNPSPLSIGRIADPDWAPGQYGGRATFSTDGAFGLEFGLCVGGQVDFDLGFQPQIILPDRLVTGVGLPLTINTPQTANSHFTTSFDGLGQAYADLILDARVDINSRICLIGCSSALSGGLDTRDVLPLSQRCDPLIDLSHPPRAALELASFNRGKSGVFNLLDVRSDFTGGIELGYEKRGTNSAGERISNELLEISISNPAMDTDSLNSRFCLPGVICSSGSEDVFAVDVNIPSVIAAAIRKENILKGEFSSSGFSGEYVIADLNIGPVVKLQLDHEMNWELWVTAMTFTEPDTTTPKSVKLKFSQGDEGEVVTRLKDRFPDQVLPPGRFHLTNLGDHALPLIELTNTEPVEVHVSYTVVPKFKTDVSVPILGRLGYELLSASAGFRSGPLDFGPYGLGPVLKGRKEVDVADFRAYSGQKSLTTTNVGTLQFTLQADGPPSFEWRPPGTDTNWTTLGNWYETSLMVDNLQPSETSDAAIPLGRVGLTEDTALASLCMGPAAHLYLNRLNEFVPGPTFTINKGFVDNRGVMWLNPDATLSLISTNAMLGGGGNLVMDGATVSGYEGPEDFTFINYNTVQGGGSFMDQRSRNGGESTLRNLSSITASTPGTPLSLSANRIHTSASIRSLTGSQMWVTADRLETAARGGVSAQGEGSVTLLYANRAEHVGNIEARNGGHLLILPQAEAVWNAGQALDGDKGLFQSVGQGSRLTLERQEGILMNGGGFVMADGGAVEPRHVNFVGSVFQVGTFDETGSDDSGLLLLTQTNTLDSVLLNNYGTVRAAGQVEVIGSKIFANHGTVDVPAWGRLNIRAITIDPNTPGAPAEVLTRPGTINASSNTLAGGTWQVAGTLLIEGASFTRTGADPGMGSAASAYLDADGQPQAIDSIANSLAYGRPASVILDGPAWDFPAISPLADNGGLISVINGAAFVAEGGFTNRGELIVGGLGSSFYTPGSYVQIGPDSRTVIQPSGLLASTLGDYQILGGTLVAESGASVFGHDESSTSLSALSIRVASTLEWFFSVAAPDNLDARPEPVLIDLGANWRIGRIEADASVTLHGSDISFDSLSAHLRQVDGRLAVSGDQLNPGRLELSASGLPFVVNGEVEVAGQYSELKVQGDYVQNSGTTTVRKGSSLGLRNGLNVTGGQFIVELGSPLKDGEGRDFRSGYVNVNGDGVLNDHLVVRFVDVGIADLGDTWILFDGSNVQEPTSVTFEGIQLAPGTDLEVVRNNLGLRVVVVASNLNNPPITYSDWLTSFGIPTDNWYPERDFDNDGISDGSEFVFGLNPIAPNDPDVSQIEATMVVDTEERRFLEVSFNRPAGDDRRSARYTAYVADHLPTGANQWQEDVFQVVDIATLSPTTERVTMRSTIPMNGEQFYVQLGGEILGLPPGLAPNDPILENPGDLTLERGKVGKVIYYQIRGNAVAGSVYGGPRYADLSQLSSAVVHAGAVPNEEVGVVRVSILDPLAAYVGSEGFFGDVFSQDLPGPFTNGEVSFTVEPATP